MVTATARKFRGQSMFPREIQTDAVRVHPRSVGLTDGKDLGRRRRRHAAHDVSADRQVEHVPRSRRRADVSGDVGSASGTPAIVIYGRPGSGCTPWHRTLLDSEKYRLAPFDQRN